MATVAVRFGGLLAPPAWDGGRTVVTARRVTSANPAGPPKTMTLISEDPIYGIGDLSAD
jgi:hypothetical protein